MLARRHVLPSALVVALSLVPALARAAPPPVAQEIAKAYGLETWGQVEAIQYTFSIALPGLKLARTWLWEPKADRVTYVGPDKAGKPVRITYVRSQVAKESDFVKNEIDPGFINDQYWLVFPFHMIWDSGAQVSDEGTQKLPLGKGTAQKVVVKYGSDIGGYTPGDTWELFVGPDHRIRELAFRHGGDAKPSVVLAAWTNYKQFGPLLLSLDHRGTADGKPFTLFFSNVAVKLAGQSTWLQGQ